MICPNKNTAEWKFLVSKYGEDGAYQKFVENGFEPFSMAESPLSTDLEELLGLTSDTNLSGLTDNINSFINTFQKRIDRVKNLAFNTNDRKERAALNERAEVLENQLEKLQTAKNITNLVETATENINYCSNILSQKELSQNDISEVSRYLALYSNFIDNFLTDFEREEVEVSIGGEIQSVKKEVYNQAVKVQDLHRDVAYRFNKLETKEGVKIINKDMATAIVEEEMIGKAKDVSFVQSHIRSASSLGNQVLTFIENTRVYASTKATAEKIKLHAQNTKLFGAIKDNATFMSKGFNLFYQNGKREDGLITEYSSDYWQSLDNFYKNLKSKKSDSIKSALSWYKDNMVMVDYTKFMTEDFNIDMKAAESYRKELSEKTGTDIQGILAESLEKFTNYKHAYDLKLAEIESLNLSHKEKHEALSDWTLMNSPIEAYKRIMDGTTDATLSDGTYPRYAFWEFFTARPLASNLNPDFDVIRNHEGLHNYYHFLNTTLTKMLKVLPNSFAVRNGIKPNFIPYAMKSFKDSVLSDGAGAMYKGMANYWVEKTAVYKESPIIYTEVDKTTGKYSRALPIYMMNTPTRIDEKTGKSVADLSKVSNDLYSTMKEAIETMTDYKHKSLVEDKVLLGRRMLNKIKEDTGKVSESGEAIEAEGLTMAIQVAEFQLDTFYDMKNKKEGILGKKNLTSEEKEDVGKLDNLIAKKLEEAKSDALSETQKGAIEFEVGELTKTKNNIGRNYSIGQMLRSVVNLQSIKTQAFNALGPAVEIMYGQVTLLSHAHGGLDFNSSQLGVANKLIFSLDQKAKNVIRNFSVVKSPMEIEEGTFNKVHKVSFYLAEQADLKNRGASSIALMLNTPIAATDLKSGESTNLYSILDAEGNIDTSLLTDEGVKNWGSESSELNNFDRFNLKMKTLNDNLFGAYDPDRPLMIKRYALGQAVTQFKTFLAEGFYSRFEGERMDYNLGRKVKGRYATLGEYYSKKGFTGFLTQLGKGLVFSKEAFADLSELDKANMKKNMVEIYFMTGLAAFIATAGMALAGDDDDEEGYSAWVLTLNMATRVQSDILYYINPSEMKGLTEKTLPALQIFTDTWDVFEASYKTLNGDYLVKQGSLKGMSNVLKETCELIPGPNAALRLYKQIDKRLQ